MRSLSTLTSIPLIRYLGALVLVLTLVYLVITFNLGASLSWPQQEENKDQYSFPSCEWAPAVPFDDHRITPLKRPKFPLTSAWLKPEAPRYGPAPEHIPETLAEEFSMGKSIPVASLYLNEAHLGSIAPTSNWTVDLIKFFRDHVRKRDAGISWYNLTDIYGSLDSHGNLTVRGKRGLVIGSSSPWCESILLEYGAVHITTLEFGAIRSDVEEIRAYTPANFTLDFLQGDIEPYDFVYTYSSLEHDGLGRYGDVLNPNGDLHTMARMLSVVKPGGFLFLGVPCCFDALHFNGHRYYGRKRLTEMFAGWRIVAMFPKNTMQVEIPMWSWAFQPIFLLQNMFGCAEGEQVQSVAGLFSSYRL